MNRLIARLLLAMLAPLALTGCLFTPGKFESTITVRADRSFTFTYVGEVMAIDSEGMGKGLSGPASVAADGADTLGDDSLDGDIGNDTDLVTEETPEETARKKQEADDRFRMLAEELRKEAGYRTVEYRGDGLFYVDYAIAGRLTHNFVFPFNQDAAMVFPWVAIELRGKDAVRVKAPGFAKEEASGMGAMGDMGAMGAMGKRKPPSKVDGIFTLVTDAEIVSQNNEAGAQPATAGKTIRWRVNAMTKDAPMAVLRVAPLP